MVAQGPGWVILALQNSPTVSLTKGKPGVFLNSPPVSKFCLHQCGVKLTFLIDVTPQMYTLDLSGLGSHILPPFAMVAFRASIPRVSRVNSAPA